MLYAGTCPNRNDNPYLYIYGASLSPRPSTIMTAYLSYLGTPTKTIELNNYRINTNTIIIEQPTTDFTTLFYNVVYAVDVDTSTNYWRCYHIRSSLCQSGKIIYKVEVDLWGSYVPFMQIRQLFVNKCNRHIDKGIYEMPNITALFTDETGGLSKLNKPFYASYDTPTIDGTTGIAYAPFSRFSLLCYINMSSSQLLGLYDATLTELLAIPLNELMGLINDLSTRLSTYQTPIDIISDLIGGIYVDDSEQYKAKVLKCFILPNEAINYHTTSTTTLARRSFKSLSKTYNGNIQFYFVKPSNSKYLMPLTKNNMDINRKYFIGTIDKGVSYTPFIDDEYLFYNYIVKTDGIQVLIEQGFNQMDITTSFEVPINAGMQGVTMLERVAYFTKLGYNVGTSITGGAISAKGAGGWGMALGAVTGAISSAVEIFKEASKCAETTNLIGNGDASTTFLWGWEKSNYANYLCWPYYMTSYKSPLDIEKQTRKYGATFATLVTDFNSIFNYSLLGTLDNYTYTYIRGVDLIIDNVPLEVADFITNKFATGITLNTIAIV